VVIDAAIDVYLRNDFSVCLRMSNDSSMGDFDKSLRCISFCGHFVPSLGRIMGFVLQFILLFLFILGYGSLVIFCRILCHLTKQ